MMHKWEEAWGLREPSHHARLISSANDKIGFLIEEQARGGFKVTAFRTDSGAAVVVEKFATLGAALCAVDQRRKRAEERDWKPLPSTMTRSDHVRASARGVPAHARAHRVHRG
jgi:hypothetical protein